MKAPRRVRVTLEDGTSVLVPPSVTPNFLGIDSSGNLVYRETEAPFAGELMFLTWCCGATGKGADVGVVCRHCYREVDSHLGGTATLSDIYVKAMA